MKTPEKGFPAGYPPGLLASLIQCENGAGGREGLSWIYARIIRYRPGLSVTIKPSEKPKKLPKPSWALYRERMKILIKLL
jgi:hypothetical protein